MTLREDCALDRRAKTYRGPMVYFRGLYTVSPFTGYYSRIGLPICYDVRNCEDFNERCEFFVCVMINYVCKNRNEGNLVGFCGRMRAGVSLL